MSERFEIQTPIKGFFGTTTRRLAKLNRATIPVQVLGLTPANSDNSSSSRPCHTHHVYREDSNCFLFDFPFPVSDPGFYLKIEASGLPPGGIEIDARVLGTYFAFGTWIDYQNRAGIKINWDNLFSVYGAGIYTFFIKDTDIVSQPFILHDDNDLFWKNNSVVLRTQSSGIFRNYRYFEGGIEPVEFDLRAMEWTDQVRYLAQILPTPAEKEQVIVQYSTYGQDVHQSNDQNTFDFILKNTIPAYMVRRLEFYGLNSDVYLTDYNKDSFDTYENRRCVYNDNHNFELAGGVPRLTKTSFSMKNYRAMGYDNRIKIT